MKFTIALLCLCLSITEESHVSYEEFINLKNQLQVSKPLDNLWSIRTDICGVKMGKYGNTTPLTKCRLYSNYAGSCQIRV